MDHETDDTSTAVPSDNETTVVPNTAATEAADVEQPTQAAEVSEVSEDETQSINAWSQADDDDTESVETHRRSWKLPIIGAALALMALIAAGIVFARPHHADPGRHSAPSVATTPPSTSPPVDPAAQDAEFISLLRASGLATTYPHFAVLEGRGICIRISRGESYSQVMDEMTTPASPGLPALPYNDAATLVDVAMHVYCPPGRH